MKNILHCPCFLMLLLFLIFNGAVYGQNNAPDYKADRQMKAGNINIRLLEKTVVYYTNKARIKRGILPCTEDIVLIKSARAHSSEMAGMNYFSHTSPVKGSETLAQRLEHAGVILKNIYIGENLGVDFILNISGIDFYKKKKDGKTVYYNGRNNSVIISQTYRQFAESMVRHWLNSPHHRKNLLNKKFTNIGVGIAKGVYNDLDALYVTQNFTGKIKHYQRIDEREASRWYKE